MGRIALYSIAFHCIQVNEQSTMMAAQRSVLATVIIIIALLSMAASSSSWFREKYNEQTYNDYYDYTVSRYSLTDNNRDTCPDIHTSASIFAITGQQIRRVTRTCSSLYVTKGTSSSIPKYTPPEAHYIQLIEVTVVDIVEFIGVFMCYLFEVSMILVSLILLLWTTLMMVMLLFCQY
jgi:hypothetical protein